MISGDIAARLQQVESAVSPVAAAAAIAADPMATPAQRVAALVGNKLADGLFNVVIGGRTLKLALPPQTEIGSQLLLRQSPGGRWVVDRPLPTVAARVEEHLGAGQFKVLIGGRTLQLALPPQTEVGRTLQLRQAADGRWAPADITSAAPGAAQTDMSQAGRLIDLLLQAMPRQAQALNDATPLLAAAPSAAPDLAATLPAALAKALATALNDSGLFYESHLQQWNAGSRNLAALIREPQAQLDSPGVSRGLPCAIGDTVPPAANLAEAATTPADAALAAGMQQAGVHPAALPVVAQQLNTLETGQLNWRGELWPGQGLVWTVIRDEEGAGGAEEKTRGGSADAPRWRTRLAVSFPHLGAVTAHLALQGNNVRVWIGAADPATQKKLGAASAALGGALAQSGIAVQSLEIEHEPTL